MTRREGWKDIVERSALTAIETSLGILVVDGIFISLPANATWSTILATTAFTFVFNVVRRRQAVLQS